MRILHAVLILLLGAFSGAHATTIKAYKSISLDFESGAVALPAVHRERIAHFVADLREEVWCPVVAVMVFSYDPKASVARGGRRHGLLRLNYVVRVLRANGLPVEVIHTAEGNALVGHPVVEVEAVGVPLHEGCNRVPMHEGFHIPEGGAEWLR